MKTIPQILFLLFCYSTAYAYVDDHRLELILKQHVDALGGRAKMSTISTLKQSGWTNSDDDKKRKVLLVRKKPNKIRLNIIDNGLRLEIAYDGSESWHHIEYNGQPVEGNKEGDPFAVIRRDSQFWLPPTEYEKSEYRFKQLEDADIDGKPQYVVQVTLEGFEGHEIYYIDQDNYLISRRVIVASDDEIVTTDYAKYREVNGVRFPFKSVTYSDDSKPSVIEFKETEINKGVFDSYFNKK